MAISKTYLYNADGETSCSNVAAWLQENAVPEYFDSVGISDDGASVICTVDGVEMLKYSPGSPNAGFVITTAEGYSKTLSSGNGYQFVYYAYKCANGIAFTSSITSFYDYFSIIITKNNNGETTVVSANNFGQSSIGNMSTANVSAISLSCVTPLKTFSFTRADYNLTTLVPFPCSNALGNPTYTPHAFWMPHSQNTAVGTLRINGVDYLSNGYWCIED